MTTHPLPPSAMTMHHVSAILGSRWRSWVSGALRRSLAVRGLLIAVIAIALLASGAIVLLERAAEQQHAAEVLVVRIEELSQEMVALERLIERDGVRQP